MSGSRFGYPNVKVGKLTNEQNIQNVKSFLYNMSEQISTYINNLENEIAELKSEIENLKANNG